MERELAKKNIEANRWKLPQGFIEGLTDYEFSFVLHEFTGESRTLQNYQDRIAHLGFNELNRVLDAGCGYGQWSIAMSTVNKNLVGVDIDESRVANATRLASQMGVHNVEFVASALEDLPFEDGYFDGIFCYSVFMFTEMPRVLKEFNRVLKQGGKLYINCDTIGWYLHLLVNVKRDRWDALKMIARTFLGKTQSIIVRQGWLVDQMERAGFSLVATGSDAEASFGSKEQSKGPQPFYSKRFMGFRTILEVAAIKK